MSISFSFAGGFPKTEKFLNYILSKGMYSKLQAYGQKGCDALSANTPVDSGLTADSWTYEVTSSPPGIVWKNTNVVNGLHIAILLQYGHGTGTGGYVQGRDYINPAIQPIMDKIADDVWREVINH